MADIFALQGPGDSGKSETIKLVYGELIRKYPSAQVQNFSPYTKDIKVIIANINGHLVGIESQGDPNSRLKQSLHDFRSANCDIIICATRTSGMTVNWVNAYTGQYTVHFVPQMQIRANPSRQLTSNSAMAQTIITQAGL